MKGKPNLKLNADLLKPGMRLAVGVSGGADSVALLRALAARAGELGLVLSVAHLHHGLRGAEADEDLKFVRELAGRLGLPFFEARVDAAAEAARRRETIEEAARRVRYAWFRRVMGGRKATAGPSTSPLQGSAQDDGSFLGDDSSLLGVDAVATAHTLEDQAETVLAKFLRGAWTEGLSGIHPVVEFPEGRVVRPLLGTTRAELEAYLKALGQEWREDSTNRQVTFTRNRMRHELLPLLEGWNPRLKEHLAQMAELARDEEAWWDAETSRRSAGVILEGKPVRGGGRAASEGQGLDLARLGALDVAVQRRVIRRAAGKLGFAPDFSGTEALRELALAGRAGQQWELAGGLRAERTHRELRITSAPDREGGLEGGVPDEVRIPVPGEGESAGFGVRVRIEVLPSGAKALDIPASASARLKSCPDTSSPLREGFSADGEARAPGPPLRQKKGAKMGHGSFGSSNAGTGLGDHAVLRNWKAGDRVHLRHSAAPKKVKEVLERLKVCGADRAHWPVLELNGRIVWMRGVVVEPEPGLAVTITELAGTGAAAPA